MACSPSSHLPRSMSLQRWEQKGPYLPANQSPDFLHVGHLTSGFRLSGGGVKFPEVVHGAVAVKTPFLAAKEM